MSRRIDEHGRATLAESGEAAAGHAVRPAGEARCAAIAEAMSARPQALEDLRWHWDEAHEIDWDDGRFKAERLDGGGGVEAATALELRALILADYTACPVPRHYQKDAEEEE